jgi:hypothetical protein
MATEVDFANLYIERILNEISELTKLKLLNETKITFIERQNQELLDRIEELEKVVGKASKKVIKLKEDVNTF